VRPRRAAEQARALAGASAEAARRYGAGRLAAAVRARRLRRRGFEYVEALDAGLLDPAVPMATARRYVSEHETTRLVDRLNPETLAAVTAEKVIFYRHFGALGLPVPELYGVVGRAGGWSDAADRPLADVAATAAFLADETPGELVVKPSAGHHGYGVRVLRREGATLVDLEGRRLTPESLARELLADPEFDLHVVQERLVNHPAVRAILDSETLQTVRMTTFVSDAGEAQLLHGAVKLASGGGNTDNFRSGTAGNAIAEVDVATGVVQRPWGDGGGRAAEAAGARMPDWEAAGELVCRAAVALMPQRTMGFDVGFTPAGPVIVEANRGYDPFPSPAFGSVVRAMERALAEGGPAEPEGRP
jgi:hypothetical protein